MHRILTVCTGNICRSPIAAALLGARLGESHTVESAGIAAVVGHPATEETAQLAAEHGLDVSAHRARQLDTALATSFDVLLVMTRHHRDWVTRHIPLAHGRTFLLGHWRDELEIPDPFRQSMAHYAHAYALIEACAEDWIPRL
jgi:protein-tyrosine phosphatase